MSTDAHDLSDLFDRERGVAWRWLSGVVIVLLSGCAAVGIGALVRSADALPTEPGTYLAADAGTEELDPERPARRRETPLTPVAERGAPTLGGRELRAGDAALVVPAAGGGAPATGLGGLPFLPFDRKRGEYLGAVRLGLWPAERRRTSDAAYANPAGFYVVTEALRRHAVSPHFTLGEFAMRDGMRGPDGESYVVLDADLLQKLERVLTELAVRGLPAGDLRILSAFRAPSYNAGVEGAAPSSRHQFGDAADVVVDTDGDGRMDDLNRDGRVDRADIRLVADAVERVERQWPALAGGLGLYDAMGPSGPFLHIDVRGRQSRWGPAGRAAPRPAAVTSTPRVSGGGGEATIRRTSRPACRAEGVMAILCAGRASRP